MEKVKIFVEQFLILEAEVSSLKRFPDLDAYNNKLNDYFQFLIKDLQGATGHLPLTELRSEAQYERLKKYPNDVPRHLYKISQYTHQNYGNVWVAYVSNTNPVGEIKSLNDVIIVIEESRELKVCTFLLYTNYSESGDEKEPFRWDNLGGYCELNFDSLNEPLNIERYLEPSDFQDGLRIYLDIVQ